MNKNTVKGYIWVGVGVLCLGLFSIPYQQAVQHATNPFVAAFGLLFSAAVFSVPNLFRIQWFPKGKFKLHCWVFFSLAILGIIGNSFYAYALVSISPAVGQVIQRSEILWVVVCCWLFFKEPAGPSMWLGILLITVGIMSMQYPHLDFKWQNWEGLFLGLLSAFCYTQLHLISKWMLPQISPLTMNTGRLIVGALLMSLIPSLVQSALEVSLEFWFWVAIAAFLGPFLSRLAFMSALLYLPLSTAMVISSLAPVLTVFFQYWFFQIETTWYQALGGSLIILGIVAGIMSHKQPTNQKPI